MTNVLRYWPDVSPQAFTVLREIAQEVQRQIDAGVMPLRYEWLSREQLIGAAADIVRCIEARDAKV